MKASSAKTGLTHTHLRPWLFGVIVGALVTAAVLFLLAALLTVKDLPQTAAAPLSALAAATGGFVGGFAAGRMGRQNGWLFGLAVGLTLFALFALLGVLAFPAAAQARMGPRLLILAGTAMLGGIIGVNWRR